MSLTLQQSNAVTGMATIMAEFIPYSGAFEAKGQVTTRSLCRKLGIERYWEKASKTRGLSVLMERILDHESSKFEPYIIETVREGIRYRQKNNNPITRREIENLNGLILEVGFKFSSLWDADFLKSLELGYADRAKIQVETVLTQEKVRADTSNALQAELDALKTEFVGLASRLGDQKAGYEFEVFLNRLFTLSGLTPREPFKVIGEQIDGSYELDSEIYLLEAKLKNGAVPESDLLIFRGKVEGKSQFTRGTFIAFNGATSQALDAITKGKQPNFFIVDGHDIMTVLCGTISLRDLLRAKLRKLAEQGLVYVPANQLDH